MPVQEPADSAGPAAAEPADRSAAPFPVAGGGDGAQGAPPLLPPRRTALPTVAGALATRAAVGYPAVTRAALTHSAGAVAPRSRAALSRGQSPPDPLRLERRLRPLFQGLPPDSGVAVAVIQGAERTVACRGFTDPATERPVRADTRFELGSVTKTFTALLLAEMVARGEVRYDDPIDKYLPAGSVPGYPRERPITLLHLATHTSGLPRLPVGLLPNAMPQWFTRPCATFNVAHLLRSLARTPVRGTPGAQVRYSSLGCGLLGLLLANAAGSRYQDLLADRVCEPLGLVDTSCGPGQEFGGGYRRGRRVPSFRIPALPGAAALRSSADDMLRYLQAHLALDAAPGVRSGQYGGEQSPFVAGPALRTALGDVRRPRVAWRLAGTRVCLSWKQRSILPAEDHPSAGDGVLEQVVFHEGSTRGFAAFAGFDPVARTGLVALISSPPTRRRRFLQTAYDTLRGLASDQLDQDLL
ncbi:CubicO group peptidase (beta-lactamase class C family) [Kitasatospora sp. MAA4]|uniref:serine hydrolase domain-containing protein n=1 Tax=Kitasatospora sp. MAA4 TaxID=3035093 RepID=UPI002473ACB4|nr:serine hydrolase domain-containing protein [Kitasatospora sp. MAA4]MDH6137066.1 CubicO group peptidase (beta-lactamase class C family) [Kitasatospora sp. MAA4]